MPRAKKKEIYQSSIIVFPNADKDEFKEEETSNLAFFPRQNCRILLASSPNGGKTTVAKNIALALNPDRVYVIHVDEDTQEYDDIDCTVLTTILDLPDNSDFEDKTEKSLIIIEDLDYDSMNKKERSKLSYLMRYMCSHYGICLIITTQNVFMVPCGVRRRMCQIGLWRHDLHTMSLICSRFGLSKNQLRFIFENICTDRHDFLMIDNYAKDNPRFRKNIYEPIDIDDLPEE